MVQVQMGPVIADQCTVCQGIFFDRGEAEVAIVAVPKMPGYNPHQAQQRYEERAHTTGYYNEGDYHPGGHRRKQRDGFLEDVFDFDD